MINDSVSAKNYFEGMSAYWTESVWKINSGTCNGLKNGQRTLKTSFNEKKNERSDFYTILLAFPVLQFCIFYIGVNVNSLFLAFKVRRKQVYFFDGFSNFKLLFENFRQLTMYRVAFINSLKCLRSEVRLA